MTKFYFAISLKPKKNSDNWGLVLANLQQTLNSIKGSSNQDYHILISTYDPDTLTNSIDTNKTTLITPYFDPPTSVKEADRDKMKNRRLIGSHLRDIETKPLYVMFLDADDLVHKDLVDFVLSDNNHRGYIVSEGYVLDIFERELRRKNEFYTICGSCYIGFFYPEEMPESADDIECYFSEHRGHRNHIKIATKKQRIPDSIPFPSVIYIKGHEESLETFKRKWKIQENKILKLVALSTQIDKKIHMLKNKINHAKYRRTHEKANKLLQKTFGLHSPTPLKVIILEKRKSRFLSTILKKYYNFVYRKTQCTKKD